MTKLSIMTLNAQGLQGKNRFKRFTRVALEWARRDIVHVWCIQEHRFLPDSVADRERLCATKGLKLIVSPATATIGSVPNSRQTDACESSR